MSASKPVSRTILFEDPKIPGEDKTVAVVTFSAAKMVKLSNYFDLRDDEGKTLVTVTWPSTLKPREI